VKGGRGGGGRAREKEALTEEIDDDFALKRKGKGACIGRGWD